MLQNVALLAEREFFGSVLRGMADANQVLVFVHGYNVTFKEAARRTGQLSYDLGFAGVPILYSWPSAGGLADYPTDEATVEGSWKHFETFLEKVAIQLPSADIFLVAHSMGSRLVARSLDSIARRRSLAALPAFHEIVLSAPDIDTGELRQLAASLRVVGARTTLYASSRDEAIAASRNFHGGQPRAGESGEHLLVVPEIETIDATAVETGLTNHSYYGDSGTIIADLYSLIHHRAAPPRVPGMKRAEKNGLAYWILEPIQN
jgi:esterase/lipase superfamily enzyme